MTQPRRPGQAASCQGKTQMNESRARKAAKSMRQRDMGAFHHYHCEHCGCWHVGEAVAGQKFNGRPKPREDKNEGAWKW